jgi:hypothetical protein
MSSTPVNVIKAYMPMDWGQLHYRTVPADPALPLLIMLHQSPLSSRKYEAVLPLLDKEFGANPSSPNALPNTNGLQWALKPGEIRQATLSSPNFVTNSMVQFTFPAPKRANVRDRVALDVLNEYLIHSPLSPTQEALVEKGPRGRRTKSEFPKKNQNSLNNIFVFFF